MSAPAQAEGGLELATFAMGSFWSAELAFQRVPGVASTCTGYAQGPVPKPTFEDVATGKTGHAQAVRVVFDPAVVTYGELLAIFWDHIGYNATTRDVCGDDSGSCYRSGIYYHTEEQQQQAERSALQTQLDLKKLVVTEVHAAMDDFWLAEDRHQRYLERLGQSAEKGCTSTIRRYG
mmetsp:Transcript_66747/g.195880  ORF Transcript_66747/g.195880 Transcript_66747/m.195880 type:complete len:177 (+) Transcript_66747:33-563(+)